MIRVPGPFELLGYAVLIATLAVLHPIRTYKARQARRKRKQLDALLYHPWWQDAEPEARDRALSKVTTEGVFYDITTDSFA
jgi:hypothetical protein